MIREFFLLGQILSARARILSGRPKILSAHNQILSYAEKRHKKEAKQHVPGFFRLTPYSSFCPMQRSHS